MTIYKIKFRIVAEPPLLHETTAGLEYAQQKGDDLTVDFSSVEFIASPLIGVLAMIASEQRGIGKRYIFTGVSAGMKTIFEMCGLDKVVEYLT